MATDLNDIEKNALDALDSVQDEAGLEAWRVAHLGRSSELMKVFSGLGALSKEERPAMGQAANRVKTALEAALAAKSESVRQAALERSRLHPSTQQVRRTLQILAEMGFQVYTSREVETDEMNFQLLNFPPHHPASEMQDNFFVEAGERGDN